MKPLVLVWQRNYLTLKAGKERNEKQTCKNKIKQGKVRLYFKRNSKTAGAIKIKKRIVHFALKLCFLDTY